MFKGANTKMENKLVSVLILTLLFSSSFFFDTSGPPQAFAEDNIFTDNIGIGNTSPTARLQIRGTGVGTGFALRIADSTPTDRLVVLDNGKVGIGTTGPVRILDVITGESASTGLGIANSTGSNRMNLFATSTSGFIYSGLQGAAPLILNAGGGNVGIGMTDPQALLDVIGGDIRINNSDVNAKVAFSGVRSFVGYNSSANSVVLQGGAGKGITFNVNNATFGSGEVARIDSTGNVGIASSTPNATKLQMGDPYTDVESGWSSTARQGLLIGQDTDNMFVGLIDEGSNADRAAIVFGDDAADYLRILRNDSSGALSELVRITYAGNVGIATTGPGNYKLNVNGSAYIGGGVTYADSPSAYVLSQGNWGIYWNTTDTGVYQNSYEFRGSGTTGHALELGTGNAYFAIGAGNVGIGTTNPLYKLYVNGSAYMGGLTLANGGIVFGGDLNMQGNDIINASNIGIGTSIPGTAALAVMGGNVGIGTTDPAVAKLVVKGSATSGVDFISTAMNSASEHLATAFDEDNNVWLLRTSGAGRPITFSMVGTEVMRINTNGNVGIGTTGPVSILDVYGGANTPVITSRGDAFANIAVWAEYDGGATADASLNLGRGISGSNPATTWYLGHDSSDSNKLKIGYRSTAGWGAPGDGDLLTIATGGNVGIGTTDPSQKLEIAGNLNFTTAATISTSGSNNLTLNPGGNVVIGSSRPILVPDDGGIALQTDGTSGFMRVSGGPTGVRPSLFLSSKDRTGNYSEGPATAGSVSLATPNTAKSSNVTRLILTGSIDTADFMVLNSNVGIGTASPVGLLQVGTSPGSGLLVTSSGNVGIGTTGPGKIMHVRHSNNNGITTDRSATSLWSGHTWVDNGVANERWFIGEPANSNDFVFRNRGATNILTMEDSGAVANTLYLKAGNVGIGTTNPLYKLYVNGSAYMGGLTLANGSIGFGGDLNMQGNDIMNASNIGIGTSIPGTAALAVMGGNVGIGTTSPAAKLGFVAATNAAGGIDFGTDTNLYRSAANILTTDDQFNITYNGSWDQLVFNTSSADTRIAKTKIAGSPNWFWLDAYADSGQNATIGLFRGTVDGTPKFFILKGNNSASPGIAFYPQTGKMEVDGDTDLYRLAANVWRTGDSLMVDGNIGIGTTGPGAKLHVSNGVIATDGTYEVAAYGVGVPGGANTEAIRILHTGSAGLLDVQKTGSGTYRNLYLRTEGEPRIAIESSSGNVGVGITGPLAKLDIRGPSHSTLGGRVLVDDDGNYNPRIRFYRWTGAASDYKGYRITDKTVTGLGNGLIFSRHSSALLGSENVTDVMILDDLGNVGIGTTNPQGTLDIKASAGSSTRMLRLTRSNGADFGGFGVEDSSASYLSLGNGDGGTSVYISSYSSYPTYFNAGNNVGIGTTNPGNYKLYVNGNAYMGGLTLANGGIQFGGDLNMQGNDIMNASNIGIGTSIPGTAALAVMGGNVGIGTTVPGAKLHVSGGAVLLDNNQELQWKNSGGTAVKLLQYTSGDITQLGANNEIALAGSITLTPGGVEDVTITTDADSHLLITGTGNVGIGTTGPNDLLEVRSSTKNIRISNDAETEAGIVMVDAQDPSAQYAKILFDASETAPGNKLLVYVDSATPSMTFTGGGNVGIGTTGPAEKLHVAGGNIALANNRAIALLTTGGTDDGTKIYRTVLDATRFEFAAGSLLIRGLDANANAVRFLNSADSDVNRIALNSGNTWFNIGNVGIGTTNPLYKLYVNGSAYMGGLTLANGGIQFGGDLNMQGNDIINASNIGIGTSIPGTAALAVMGGNVGIGTTSPNNPLEIAHGLATTPAFSIWRNTATGNSLADFSTGTTKSVAWTYGHEQGAPGPAFIIAEGTDIANPKFIIKQTSGNVGIGTTGPSQLLEVAGNIELSGSDKRLTSTGWLQVDATNGIQFMRGGSEIGRFNDTDGNFGINVGGAPTAKLQVKGAGTGAGLAFLVEDSAGTDKVGFLDNGNVGIGTASPDAKFSLTTTGSELGGTAASSTFRTLAGSLGTAPGATLKLASIGFSAVNDSSLGIEALRTASGTNWTTTAIGLKMDVDNTSPVNNAQIWLTAGGNVGIGTTGPLAKLHVSGNTILGDLSASPLGSTAEVSRNTASGATTFGIVNAGDVWFQMTADNDLLSIDSSVASDVLNLVASTGNVGIGTTNPTYKLYVNGSAYMGGLTLANGGIVFGGDLNMQGNDIINASNIGIGTSIPGTAALAVMGGNVGIGTTNPFTGKLHVQGGDVWLTTNNARLAFSTDGTTDSTPNGAIKASGNDLTIQQWSGSSYLDRVFFQGSSGNVGIGTTNPQRPLDVYGGPVYIDPILRLESDDDDKYTQMQFTGTGRVWNIGIGNNTAPGVNNKFFIYDETATAFRMTVDTSGYVGIGTTGPAYKLQVESSDAWAAYIRQAGTGGVLIGSEAGASKIASGSGQALWFGINGAEKMRLDANGNLGIGTDSPGNYKLYVNGSAYMGGLTLANGGIGFGGDLNMQGNDIINASNIGIGTSIPGTAALAVMGGSVGIGTTSPSYTLDVNGTINGGPTVRIAGSSPNITFARTGGNYPEISGGQVLNLSATYSAGAGGEIGIYSKGNGGNGIALYSPNAAGTATQRFKVNGGYADIVNVNVDSSNFAVNTNQLYVQQSTGSVGIGTASPIAQSKLTVPGSISITGSDSAFGSGGPRTIVDWEGGAYNVARIGAVSGGSGTSPGLALIVAGGTKALNIKSDGNVGIGTTGPVYLLDIFSSGANPTVNIANSNGSGTGLRVRAYGDAIDVKAYDEIGIFVASVNNTQINQNLTTFGNDLRIKAPANQPLILGANNTEYMRILSGGNVGIGTTDPGTYKLYVNGSAYMGGLTLANGGIGFGGDLNMQGNDIINASNIGIGTSIPGTAALAVMGGNTGIGTTSPGGRFHIKINSDGTLPSNLSSDYSHFIYQNNPGIAYDLYSHMIAGTNGIAGMMFGDADSGYSGGIQYYNNGDSMRFQTAGSEQVRIINNGYVGIGTTGPNEKLEINGNLKFSGAATISTASGDLTLNPTGNIVAAAGKTIKATTFSSRARNYDFIDFEGGGAYVNTWRTQNTAGNGAQTRLNIPSGADVVAVGWQNIDTMSFDRATTISTTAGALTLQPVSGNNLNVTLATTGDFAVNTNQLYVDTSAGNVGIGTASPLVKLAVSGGAIGIDNNQAYKAKNSGGTYINVLSMDSGTNNMTVGSSALGGLITFDEGYGTPVLRIYQQKVAVGTDSPAGLFQVGTSPSPGLLVTSGGYVGIGTTGPGAKLHVAIDDANTNNIQNAAQFYHTTTGTPANGIGTMIVLGTENTAGAARAGQMQYSLTTATAGAETGLWEFRAHDNAAYDTRLAIKGGNVGIGTTNPGNYKLYVNGSAYMGGLTLANGGISFGGDVLADSADTRDLGSTSKEWRSLYLGDVGKIYFGLNQDTNLYRSAANTLKTDDNFVAASGISWGTAGANLGTDQGASMEFRGTGLPYMDWSNDAGIDFDVRLQLNGDDAFSIQGGNVGINEATPGSYLSVKGGVSIGETTDYSQKAAPTGGMIVKGNVGIGTTDPGAKLHVFGRDSGQVSARFLDSAMATDAYNRIKLGRDPSTYNEANLQFYYAGAGSGSNYLGVCFYGTADRLVVRADGSVGIGTTGPTGAALHIVGLTGFASNIGEVETVSTARFQSRAGDANSLWIAEGLPGQIIQASDGAGTAKQVVINPFGGNVGIGTTGPTKLLEVNGETLLQGHLFLTDNMKLFTGSQDSSPFFMTSTTFGTNGATLLYMGYDSKALILGGNATQNYDHGVQTNPTLFIQSATAPDTDNTQYISFVHDTNDGVITTGKGDIVLSPAGNVGIGTTGPDAKLTLAATALTTTAYSYGGGTGDIGAFALNVYRQEGAMGGGVSSVDPDDTLFKITGYGWGVDNYYNGAKIAFQVDGNVNSNDMPGRITFYTAQDGSATLTERMRITNSGNVGIGTTNPLYKLYVNGSAYMGGLTLANGGIQFGGDLNMQGNDIMNASNIGIGTSSPGTAALAVMGGSVGIGTTSPGYTLDVNGVTYLRSALLFADGGVNIYTPNDNQAAYFDFLTDDEAAVRANDAILRVWGDGTGGSNLISISHTGASGYGVISTGAGNLMLDAAGIIDVVDNVHAPIYKDRDDTNYYLDPANTGTSAVFAGNVGIGTASPGARLHLQQNAAGATPAIIFDDNGADTDFWIGRDGSNNGANDDYFRIGSGTTEGSGILFTINYSGNVGIGTTEPASLLEVRDQSAVQTTPLVLRNEYGTGADLKTVGMAFRGGNGYWAAIYGGQQNTNDWNFGKLTFGTRTSDALGVETKMTILANGNVGIGTTNPLYKLYVNGSAYMGGLTLANGSIGFGGDLNMQGNDIMNASNIGIGTSIPGTAALAVMGGNVGIGTTSPGYKLSLQTNDNWDSMSIYNSSASGYAAIKFQGSGETFYSGVGGASVSNYPNLWYVHHSGGFMAMNNQGNVGIGTTGPVEKLVVKGNLKLTPDSSYIAMDDTSYIYFGDTNWQVGKDGGGNMRLRGYIASNGDKVGLQDATGNTYFLYGTKTAGTLEAHSAFPFFADASGTALTVPNGSVGIGTTGPGSTLHISYTDDTGATGIKVGKTDVSSGYLFSDNWLSIGIDQDNSQTNAKFQIYKNGTVAGNELLTVQENGNVGIGTTDPLEKLQVGGNIKLSGTYGPDYVGHTENNVDLYLKNTNAGGAVALQGDGRFYFKKVEGTNMFSYANGLYVVNDTSGSEKFRIDTSSGNVGIGTTNPLYKLYVNGNAYMGGITLANGNIQFGGDLNMQGNDIINASNIGIGTSTPGTAALAVMGGNVGIGTTGPNEKLEINGNLKFSGAATISNASGDLTINSVGVTNIGASNLMFSNAGAATLWGPNGADTSFTIAARNNAGGTTTGLIFTTRDNTDSESTRLTITSGVPKADVSFQNSNVGIGITNPLAPLAIANGANPTQIFRAYDGASNVEIFTIADDGKVGIGGMTSPAGRLEIRGQGTGAGMSLRVLNSSRQDKVVILDNGNVGIGNTGPAVGLHIGTAASGHSLAASNDLLVSGKLEVDGYSYFDSNIYIADSMNIKMGNGAFLGTLNSDNNYYLIHARDNGVGMVEVGRVASAADPYVSFGGSQQFKFYNSGTADFGGNTYFTAGSVGIGTTGPSSTLEVRIPYAKTDTTDIRGLSIYSNEAVNQAGIEIRLKGGASQTARVATLQTRESAISDSGALALQPNGGSVGIGTTNPGGNLSVIGNAAGQVGLHLNNTNNSTGYEALRLGTDAAAGTGVVLHQFTGDQGGGAYSANTANLQAFESGGLALGSDNGSGKITFFVGGHAQANEKMRINSAGNVGIGTTGPGRKFEIKLGATNDDGLRILSDSGNMIGQLTTVGASGARKGQLYLANEGSTKIVLDANTSGISYFDAGGNVGIGTASPVGLLQAGTSPTAGLLVTSAGSVGIGITSPGSYKLYVNGTSYFNGQLTVTNLNKLAGSFMIDHPLDPANKVLRHSFTESPDMKNFYDGVAVLNEKGECAVNLPDYFESLNKDFRYQLTPVGKPAMLYIKEEIKDNKFVIAGGEPGMKVNWQVTGIRQDAYANRHRIVVEEEKGKDGATKEGEYLCPDCFTKLESESPKAN